MHLGRYVRAVRRSDGTYRVLFVVPPRHRPPDWPCTIPLPIGHGRIGELGDPIEVERIRHDADVLYRRFRRAKQPQRFGIYNQSRDLLGCVRLWQTSQQWKSLRPSTRRGYQYDTGIILKWAHRSVAALDLLRPHDVEEFLSQYDDRPSQRYSLGRTLRLILKQAVKAGWLRENPASHVVVKQPKTTVQLWSVTDVQRYILAAEQVGQVGLAALIHVQWEIGQRLSDVVGLRHDAEYVSADAEFRFHQSKTGTHLAIPISAALKQRLEGCRSPASRYLFVEGTTGRPFSVNRLSQVFAKLRPAGEGLVLRALRHSCVVELARAGCAVPEIVAITGHSLASAHRILQVYLPRDSTVARNAQRKRGLI